MTNSTDYADKICPIGHYCPAGTTLENEYPCPAGTYNPTPQQISDAACLPCTPGKYCLTTGLDAVTDDCAYVNISMSHLALVHMSCFYIYIYIYIYNFQCWMVLFYWCHPIDAIRFSSRWGMCCRRFLSSWKCCTDALH